MRALLLALAVAWCGTAAQAQAPPGTPTGVERARWQLAADIGIAGPWLGGYGSLAAQRRVRDALALGGRVGVVGGQAIPFDDGGSQSGGFAETFVSLGYHGADAMVRLDAGAGIATIDYSTGYVACFPLECEDRGFRGLRPYGLAGVGVTAFFSKAVGVGADVRIALMEKPASVTSASAGVRVRLAR